MIRGLDERTQVELRLINGRFSFPIVHVPCVETGAGEQVDRIHEQLLSSERDLRDDGDFLAIGKTFEKNLRRILRVVRRIKSHVILADCIRGRLTMREHALVEHVVRQHCRVPFCCVRRAGGGGFEGVPDVRIERVEDRAADVGARVVIMLIACMRGGDGEDFLSRVRNLRPNGAIGVHRETGSESRDGSGGDVPCEAPCVDESIHHW